ncbi:MAG: hypothetical protein NVS3B14_18960 [Ktedonobacteraceae bacterium]
MALRKEQIDDNYDEESQAMKERIRITIDISPELRKRIKVAALQKNLSISEYLSNILEQSVPDEIIIAEQARHPVPPDILDEVYRIREQVIRESKGHIFEDSTEVLRRMREERTEYIEQLREPK